MASIALAGVRKVYPNGHIAVHGLDLDIADGELMVLVGPSGSGKSTALRLIAGLETPTAGSIRIGSDDVTAVPPQDRDLAMVFQNYALYPHKTVRQNLAFPLRMRGVPREALAARVARIAASLGLETMLDRKPAQLSGGQRQRVALGRAAVREPRAFLLDEPLSNLDPALRVRTRAELALLHRQLNATMVYVTHDQEEAMTLGDRIAVLNDGALQQVAPPLELYRAPANVFVAGFIGSPAMNFFHCALREDEGTSQLACESFTLPARAGLAGSASMPGTSARALTVGIRPQDVRVTTPEDGAARGTVTVIEPLGSELRVHIRLDAAGDAPAVVAILPPDHAVAADDVVGLRFPTDRLHVFDAESGRRL